MKAPEFAKTEVRCVAWLNDKTDACHKWIDELSRERNETAASCDKWHERTCCDLNTYCAWYNQPWFLWTCIGFGFFLLLAILISIASCCCCCKRRR
ncbi:unnamed protein product [Caenorhabditis sp. 36 PRJEB53466]|nr:unnamed protein product [Caenorhabditis sp. 36 PRJEB53466]